MSTTLSPIVEQYHGSPYDNYDLTYVYHILPMITQSVVSLRGSNNDDQVDIKPTSERQLDWNFIDCQSYFLDLGALTQRYIIQQQENLTAFV